MRKFKVGEEVTVRTWEDMKKAYGAKNVIPVFPKESLFGLILNIPSSKEYITTPEMPILDMMKPYCGRKMKIAEVHENDTYILEGTDIPYIWTAEAFEEFWKKEETESTEVEKKKQERKDMPKLENGMVVELRNGKRFLVAEFFGEQSLLSNKCWCCLNDMDFKTGKSSFDSTFDIVKVIKPYCPNYLKALKQSNHIIWEAE